MKKLGTRFLSSICVFALTANSVIGVTAQEKREEGKIENLLTGVSLIDSINITAIDPAGGSPEAGGSVKGAWLGGGAFQFFLQEMSFDNRLVLGAPFSADIVSETIQTLSDGTRITQRFEGRIHRDGQGRTRNERTFLIGESNKSKQTITIYDPVGGSSYTLDPETRTARKAVFPITVAPTAAPDALRKANTPGKITQGKALKRVQPPYPPMAKAARATGLVQVEILIGETGETLSAVVVSGHPLLREAALQASWQWRFEPTELSGKPVKIRGILNYNFALIDEEIIPAQTARNVAKYEVSTEQLSKQIIEGVECDGERKVTTMAVGVIGNDRPIETVSETWYSPELRMMILSKRSDPRFGESTYRVSNITRTEPAASLFQVTSDYTIKDAGK